MTQPVQTSLLEDSASVPAPEVAYIPVFTDHHEIWFDRLARLKQWDSRFKSRKTCTFGVSYNYRRGIKKVRDMPGFLGPVCERIEDTFGYRPNNCVANYYPSGEHYISPHSDQDMEMKARSGVTIVSLGAVRTMVLRNTEDRRIRFHYALQPGSAFFMADAIQGDWQHGIPREAGAGARISLSFRALLE